MKPIALKVDQLVEPLRKIALHVGEPILILSARLYLGWAFFKSGLGRYESFTDSSWDTQVFLFNHEHPLPGIPGEIAAPLATIMELALPVLLLFGLFSRFAAAGLLMMTLVIELTYIHSNDHILWGFLALMIIIRGPGPLSADHFLVKWLRK